MYTPWRTNAHAPKVRLLADLRSELEDIWDPWLAEEAPHALALAPRSLAEAPIVSVAVTGVTGSGSGAFAITLTTPGSVSQVRTDAQIMGEQKNEAWVSHYPFPLAPVLAPTPLALGGLPAHYLLGSSLVVISPHIVSRQALINATIIFENTHVAHNMCALNGWGKKQLRMHALKLGILYRQVDVVSQALDELAADQGLAAIAELLAFFDEASSDKTSRDYNLRDFARALGKLALQFLSSAIAHAEPGSETSSFCSDALVRVRAFLLASSRHATKFLAASEPSSGSASYTSPSAFSPWASLHPTQVIADALTHGTVSAALGFLRSRDERTPSGEPYSLASLKSIGSSLAIIALETYAPTAKSQDLLGPGALMLSSLGIPVEPVLVQVATQTRNASLRARIVSHLASISHPWLDANPRAAAALAHIELLEEALPLPVWPSHGDNPPPMDLSALDDPSLATYGSRLAAGEVSIPPPREPLSRAALLNRSLNGPPLELQRPRSSAPVSAESYFVDSLQSIIDWDPQTLGLVMAEIGWSEAPGDLDALLEMLQEILQTRDHALSALASLLADRRMYGVFDSPSPALLDALLTSPSAASLLNASTGPIPDPVLPLLVRTTLAKAGSTPHPSVLQGDPDAQLDFLASSGLLLENTQDQDSLDMHAIITSLSSLVQSSPTLRVLYLVAHTHNVPTTDPVIEAFRAAASRAPAPVLAAVDINERNLPESSLNDLSHKARLLVAVAKAALEVDDPSSLAHAFARFEWDPPPRPEFPTLFALLQAHPVPPQRNPSDPLPPQQLDAGVDAPTRFDILTSTGDMSLMDELRKEAQNESSVGFDLNTVWSSSAPIPSVALPPPALNLAQCPNSDLDIEYRLRVGQPVTAYSLWMDLAPEERQAAAGGDYVPLLRSIIRDPGSDFRVRWSALLFARLVDVYCVGLHVDAVLMEVGGPPMQQALDALPVPLSVYTTHSSADLPLTPPTSAQHPDGSGGGNKREWEDVQRLVTSAQLEEGSPEWSRAWRAVALASRVYSAPLDLTLLATLGRANDWATLLDETTTLGLAVEDVASHVSPLIADPRIGDHVSALSLPSGIPALRRAWTLGPPHLAALYSTLLVFPPATTNAVDQEWDWEALVELGIEMQAPFLVVLADGVRTHTTPTPTPPTLLAGFCRASLPPQSLPSDHEWESIFCAALNTQDGHVIEKAYEILDPTSPHLALVRGVRAFEEYRFADAQVHLENLFSRPNLGDAMGLVTRVLEEALNRAPTRYEKSVLLRVVEATRGELELPGGRLSRAWRVSQVLRKVGLEDSVDPDGSADEVIAALMEASEFDAARDVASIRKVAADGISLCEAGMLVAAASANGWMYESGKSGSDRRGLWRQCDELFIRHTTNPEQVGDFFYSLGTSLEPPCGPDELYVLYSLALQWYTKSPSKVASDPGFLDVLQTDVWTLRWLPESYAGTSSVADASKLIVYLLNSGKISEAMSIASKLGVTNSAVEAVQVGLSLVRDGRLAESISDTLLAVVGASGSRLDVLRKLQGYAKEVKDAFEHIIVDYRVGEVLELAYNDVLAKDPYQVVFVLLHQGSGSLSLAGKFIKLHVLDAKKVASLLAKVYVLSLEKHAATLGSQGGDSGPEFVPMWTRSQFSEFAGLCGDLTRLGDALLDAMTSGLAVSCEAELITCAHFCYQAAGAADVVDALLELVRAKSSGWIARAEYRVCAFVFVELERYEETRFLLDALVEGTAFDLLFGMEQAAMDWRLQQYLVSYLEAREPQDLAQLTKLYATYGMIRQRAATLKSKADEAMASVAGKTGPGVLDEWIAVFRLYVEAAKSFQLEDCLGDARVCMRSAALVGLQLERPNAQLLGLSEEESVAAMLACTRFGEANIVAQAYGVGTRVWVRALYRHAVRNGDHVYFEEYKRTLGAEPSMFVDLWRYGHHSPDAGIGGGDDVDAFVGVWCSNKSLKDRLLAGEFAQGGGVGGLHRTVSVRR